MPDSPIQLDRVQLEHAVLSRSRESTDFLLRRAIRTMDASVLREWLGARTLAVDAIPAPLLSLDDRVEAFVGRTFGAKYATRRMPQGGMLPEPTCRWLGECAALLEECCEVHDTPRRAFERLFALIEPIEVGELGVVTFVELGPLELLPFKPEDAMPAYFDALARDVGSSASERRHAVDAALRLVRSGLAASRLRESAVRLLST